MKLPYIHPFSAVAGLGLAIIGLFAMAQAPVSTAPKWEYRIVDDVDHAGLEKLAADGWDYVGYLGQGTKGASNDETLWKRPHK